VTNVVSGLDEFRVRARPSRPSVLQVWHEDCVAGVTKPEDVLTPVPGAGVSVGLLLAWAVSHCAAWHRAPLAVGDRGA
jgi:hypothetical protein